MRYHDLNEIFVGYFGGLSFQRETSYILKQFKNWLFFSDKKS